MVDGIVTLASLKERIGKHTLFVIERNRDDQLVVYTGLRTGNELRTIDAYWTTNQNPLSRVEIGPQAKEMFYDTRLRSSQKRGLYHMKVKAFPDRVINLYLLKNGGVTAKAVIDGREAKIEKFYYHVEGTTVTKMVVHGTFNKQPVSELIPVPATMQNGLTSVLRANGWI